MCAAGFVNLGHNRSLFVVCRLCTNFSKANYYSIFEVYSANIVVLFFVLILRIDWLLWLQSFFSDKAKRFWFYSTIFFFCFDLNSTRKTFYKCSMCIVDIDWSVPSINVGLCLPVDLTSWQRINNAIFCSLFFPMLLLLSLSFRLCVAIVALYFDITNHLYDI